MQQIYRRTNLPKCDLNKVTLQLYGNHTSAWVLSCKFATYFRNNFFYEHLWTAAFVMFLWKAARVDIKPLQKRPGVSIAFMISFNEESYT